MANIELKIVALGDFSSVNQQIKALQVQVEALRKNIAGVGLDNSLSNQLKNIQSEFKATMLSTGQFTAQTVKLTSETEKFGQALQAGKLKLGDYFSIITKRSGEAQKSVQALAVEQVKLNNSLVVQDITQKGVYSVYTPTKINAMAKATEIAAAKQTIYNIAVQQGSQKLIDWGKNTQWAGRQLTVGLAMPLIMFGSTASKVFKDFNEQLVRLQKVYGTGLSQPTKQALNDISGQVTKLSQELAKSMGIAVKDTAAMAADIAATGKTGNDLIVATREAMRLQKLGEMDTQSAMQTTISLQNVYKLNTQQLSGAIDFLNAVENQTSTSLQDLAAGIPKVGPVVQQLGGSFKDTAVMMVAMKEAGVPAAQSANAIKSALASLINPTKAAKDAFAAYNINLAGIATSTNGNPIQMIMQLQSALKGLAPLAQAQLIEKLFGKFQEARIQALITNLGAVNSQTKTAFDLAGSSAPQLAALAAAELKTANESTSGKFKRAIETMKADLLPVGQKIMEVATSLLNFGNSIANFFSKLPGPIKGGLGILLALGALAGPIIMLTGLFANFAGYILRTVFNIGGLITGTKKFSELFTPASIAARNATDAFNMGLMENVGSVDLLNGAIMRLTTSITEMVSVMGAETAVTGLVAAAETAAARGALKVPFSHMASGGYVPGSGNTDSFPAMLMPGEAVIPKDVASQHSGLITGLINRNIPGFAFGLDPSNNRAFGVQRGHAVSGHGSDMLALMNTPEMLAQQGGYKLSSVNSVTRGAMIGMTTDMNQWTKGANGNRSAGPGATGSQLSSEFDKMSRSGIDPMAELKESAHKLGANMKKAGPILDEAFKNIKDELGKNPEKMFGMKPGQKSLESFIEEHLRPALKKIDTAAGKTLDEVTQNTIGTRGSGRGRSGSSGQVFYRENDGRVVKFSESSAGKYLKPGDVHTSGATLAGAYGGKAKDYNALVAGGASVDDALKGAQTKGKIKSPSGLFEEKVGKPLGQGIKKGVKEQVAADAMFYASQGEKVAEEVGKGVNSPNAQGKLQGLFSKAFGANSKLGGMMKSPMGRLGGGMALGMVSQMAAPMISKALGAQAGGIANDAMTGASMGMAFGPWGAAAGAALGGVIGGIKLLIETEKKHKLEAESAFKSSSDAVEFLGAKLANTTHQMNEFRSASVLASAANNDVAKGVSYTNGEMDQFKAMVTGLPKDNPLAVIVNQMKEASNGASARKIADTFVQTQMAINGISKAQADKLMQLMLTMSGHSAAGAGVTASDQLHAISRTLQATMGNAKQFSDFIGQISNVAINTTSWDNFKAVIDGIGQSGATSSQIIQGLVKYLNSVGDYGGATLASNLQMHGYSAEEILAIQKANNAGINVNTDKIKPGDKVKFKDLETAATNALAKAEKAKTAATNASANATAIATAASDAKIKSLEAEKKAIDKTIKSMEDALKAQQNQANFDQSKGDLKQQILMARANGDNLKAQLLQQQLMSKSADFKAQTAIDEKKAESDRLAEAIANAQSKANEKLNTTVGGNTTATKNNTDALNTKNDPKKGQTSGGGITDVAHGDVGKDFGTTLESAKSNIDTMQKAGMKIPDFKGKQWTQEYIDPETGAKSQQLTTEAMRYVVDHGNGGKGYEAGDQFMFDGKVYEVKTGASAWGNSEAVIKTGYTSMTPSSKQQYTKSNPYEIGRAEMAESYKSYMNGISGGVGIKTTTQNALGWYDSTFKGGKPSKDLQTFIDTILTGYGNISALGNSSYFSIDNQEYHKNKNAIKWVSKLKGKAIGGPVVGGTSYVVGEKGPEIFTPTTSGNIIPHDKKDGWLQRWAKSISGQPGAELMGTGPLLRILAGLPKESNWDYLGASTVAMGGLKGMGLLPKMVKPLLGLAEGFDLTQGSLETKMGTASSASHEYHVNINIAKVDSSVDIERAVASAFDKVKQKQNMSGTTYSKVGSH